MTKNLLLVLMMALSEFGISFGVKKKEFLEVIIIFFSKITFFFRNINRNHLLISTFKENVLGIGEEEVIRKFAENRRTKERVML